MFIESLKVSYPSEGWSLEETKFDRFNLLVGASGVGKTKILKAIESLQHFAIEIEGLSRFPHPGMQWELKFAAERDTVFFWEGEIVRSESNGGYGEDSQHFFKSESISRNGIQIAKREGAIVSFGGTKMPMVNSQQSLFSIFGYDEGLSIGFRALGRIVITTEETLIPVALQERFELTEGKEWEIETIRKLNAPITLKLLWLYFASEIGKKLFRKIEEAFEEIFPNIDHLTAEIVSRNGKPVADIFLIEKWQTTGHAVSLDFFSSGMRKTLALLAQIELCPDNSLILIDEFENSLGANCIDLVAEAVRNAGRGLQFIITSHHPYIINRIGAKHWKIVTRKGGTVSTHSAEEFGLGHSRHENFFQLINLEAFTTGSMEAQ